MTNLRATKPKTTKLDVGYIMRVMREQSDDLVVVAAAAAAAAACL